jgi:hypothetical protein
VDLPFKTRAYIYGLILAAIAGLGYYARDFSFASTSQIIAFALFIVLGFLAEIYATWIPVYGGEVSSSITIYLAALFILGPSLAVVIVFLATLASEVVLRWEYLRASTGRFLHVVLFNVSQFVVTVAATGAIFLATGRSSLTLMRPDDYLWALASFAAYASVNLVLVTAMVTATEQKGFVYALKRYLRDFGLQYVVLCVLALLLGVLYSLSIWHMFLAIIPLALVHLSFRSYVRLQTETRKTFEKISQLLDERDHYTAVHSTAVAELAVEIGQALGLAEGDIEKIDIAARVHDIGKIAVPDSILLKHGRLTSEEWAVMKRHPVTSAELIEGLEIYAPVADAVLHEHERWNGSGYPDGLRGEGIPLLSRIIAAADVYNALSTDRPYRKAFDHETVLEMIEKMRGEELDPRVGAALLIVLRRRFAALAASGIEPEPEPEQAAPAG